MLETAGDKCTVMYALARTWAAGGQYQKAMDVLEKTVALKAGLDPGNDEIFTKLRESREFKQLLGQIRDDTPPVSQSRAAFRVGEADLFPEGIAYDALRNRFLLGSTFKRQIIECTAAGACQTVVHEGQDGLGGVLGIKADPNDGTIWAASNGPESSALFHYSASGKLIRKYSPEGKAGLHLLNDLVIDSRGNVFVTDTKAGTVYWLARGANRLEVFNPVLKIAGANGIAVSEEPAPKLYVAGFPDGITVVDIASRSSHAIAHPSDLCLATIDGLYFFDGSLIAIQNGIMVPRVVRYRLGSDRESIDRLDILERRNPLFDGITTGAIADGAFYFMANTQIDNVTDGKIKAGARLNPIQILRIDL